MFSPAHQREVLATASIFPCRSADCHKIQADWSQRSCGLHELHTPPRPTCKKTPASDGEAGPKTVALRNVCTRLERAFLWSLPAIFCCSNSRGSWKHPLRLHDRSVGRRPRSGGLRSGGFQPPREQQGTTRGPDQFPFNPMRNVRQ